MNVLKVIGWIVLGLIGLGIVFVMAFVLNFREYAEQQTLWQTFIENIHGLLNNAWSFYRGGKT